jgi:hypothetical protein
MSFFKEDDSVNVALLDIGTVIRVRTHNTLYTFTIVRGGITVDDDGIRCPNGPVLTCLWWNIRLGNSMLFSHPTRPGKAVRTSRVESISVADPDGKFEETRDL